MFRHCLTLFFISSVLASNGYGETLEAIRQQFEIYQRLSGEIEILSTDDAKELDNVLKRTETKRLAVRKELDRAQNERKKSRNLPSPLFAEEYAAPFIHYVAAERAFAKRSLEQGKPDDVIPAIQYVYRLAEKLSESGSLELRTVAALIRLQMLETAQLLVFHQNSTQEHHKLLYKILEDQINSRTTDAVIWTHYREEGKQFFADVTKHALDTLISPELLKKLMDKNALSQYQQAAIESVEYDKSVFLHLSEVIIKSCDVPFFKRQPLLRTLDNELRKQRGAAKEPVFALLLLQDVTQSMRLFAQERSGIETAYLALAASQGNQERSKTLNFLTGNEYEIRLIADGVMCTYAGNVKPFYAPYR